MFDILYGVMVILALLFMFSLGYGIGYKSGLKYVFASIYAIINKHMEEKDAQD